LWERAAALGVPVTIHEGLSDGIPTLGRDRFENPAMLHVLSHPLSRWRRARGSSWPACSTVTDARVAFLERVELVAVLARAWTGTRDVERLLPAVRMKPRPL
jgi:hypothetical protein